MSPNKPKKASIFALQAFLLLSATFASGQSKDPPEERFDIPFAGDCGLVTRYEGSRIPPACLQEALNIVLDEDFTLRRRKGQGVYNITPCTDEKSIRGLWPFSATDGTEYIVILSSQSMFISAGDGSCTRIAGINGLSTISEMQCVQSIGELYCTNGTNTPFVIDGSTVAYPSGMPLGSLIGAFRNRIMVANISGSLTRIRMSGELDGTDWTIQIPGRSTTPVSIDISGLNDGREVTCLMGEYQNAFIIGRENDLWGLYGNDRRDFTLRNLSREIGCIGPKSVQEKNNSLYWMSRRGIERLTGTTISRASDNIRPDIDVIILAAGNSVAFTDTTQSDFEAGNVNGVPNDSPMNTDISPGNVVPSTWTRVDTSSSDWVNGTLISVTTSYADGLLALSTITLTDNFSDGDYTSDPTWTIGGDDFWSVASERFEYDASTADDAYVGYAHIESRSKNNGQWSYALTMAKFRRDELKADFIFSASNSNPSTANGYMFRTDLTGAVAGACTLGGFDENVCGTTNSLYRMDSGSLVLLSSAITATGGGFPSTVTIAKSGSAISANFVVGTLTATDSTYTDSTNIILRAISSVDNILFLHGVITFDDIEYPGFQSTGTIVSQIFDTGFSTPVGGPFRSTFTTVENETYVNFDVRSSTSPNDDFWSNWSATSDTLRVALQERYQQYQIRLNTDISTKTPSVLAVSLEAATTGFFIGQCREPGSDITSWGNFSCAFKLNDGSFTLFTTSGVSCNEVTRTTATWTEQPNNSPIVVSTSTFIGYRVQFTVDSSTQNLTLNSCTIRADLGASRPAVASEVYRDRYWLFYTTSTSPGATNDHVWLLDQNDKWTLLDNINAHSATVYQNRLYTGDSSDTGIIRIQNVGQDDFGSDYTMRFRTPDFDMGNPVDIKSFKRLYVYLRSEEEQSQDISLAFSYRIDGSTKTYSLGDCDLDEAAEKGLFICKMPFPTDDGVDARWLSIEMEYTGDQGPVSIIGMRLIYSRKEPE